MKDLIQVQTSVREEIKKSLIKHFSKRYVVLLAEESNVSVNTVRSWFEGSSGPKSNDVYEAAQRLIAKALENLKEVQCHGH